MKLSFLPFLVLFLAAFAGCSQNPEIKDKQITTFSQTPHFIKSFLDTLYNGKFLIAETGEKWVGGCLLQDSLPSRQFISALLHNNRYELIFRQGGFIDTRRKLVIQFIDTTVESYTFRNL